MKKKQAWKTYKTPLKEFLFPDKGIVVKAENIEEAIEKYKKLLSSKK